MVNPKLHGSTVDCEVEALWWFGIPAVGFVVEKQDHECMLAAL